MNTHTMTHATLLARVAAGEDPEAWQEFCDRYARLIRGFAVRRNLQPMDCDEVVQEVLLALAKALPRFKYDPVKGKFRSYLKTIVVHEIQRKKRQTRGEVQLGEMQAAAESQDQDSAAEQEWELEWRQYHIRRALRVIECEFADQDRRAFQAYAVEGRDAAEVAEALNLSVDQIYQAKSRIVRRLAMLIEAQIEEEG